MRIVSHGERAAESEFKRADDAANLVPCDSTRTLVVDDEKAVVMIFQYGIEHELPGVSVDSAENGQAAVEAFSRGHHAVLVMDLSMPVMDGQHAFQAIERLCKERNWEMPAVLFCTGYAPPGSLNRILEHSAHGLLLKPVTGVDVARAVLSRLRH